MANESEKKNRKYISLITVLIVGIIFVMIIVMLVKGVQVSMDNEGLSVSGGVFYSVDIPYEDIDEVKLETSVDFGKRTNGAYTVSYNFGNYRNSEYGGYKLFVKNAVKSYIVVRYRSTETLVFNCSDEAATKEKYESLLKEVNK